MRSETIRRWDGKRKLDYGEENGITSGASFAAGFVENSGLSDRTLGAAAAEEVVVLVVVAVTMMMDVPFKNCSAHRCIRADTGAFQGGR